MNIAEVRTHRIDVKDAANYYEQEKAVEGKVFGYVQKNTYVEAYMGGDYPNYLLTIRLRGECQELAGRINGKMIRVIGGIIRYKSKPMITVNKKEQIEFL